MKLNKLLVLLVGSLSLAGIVGCSYQEANPNVVDDVNEVTEHPTNKLIISDNGEVDSYIKNQSFNPDKVLAFDLTGAVAPSPSTSGEISGTDLIVTRKVVRDAASGTGSLNAVESSTLIYPGELLKANKHLVEGNPSELSNLGRGRTTFDIALPGIANPTFSVNVTNRGNVNGAINTKVAEWATLGKKLTAKQSFRVTQAFDSNQLNVKLGFGIAEKLNISADYHQGDEKNVFVISFEQIFYSVNTSMYSDDTVVFDDTVTRAKVEAECPDSEPPVIITQANYGKMVYFKVETSLNENQVNAAFKYAGKFDVESKGEFKRALANCDVTCLTYGGMNEYPSATTITGDKEEQINAVLLNSLIADANSVENAVLLNYRTSWLKNGNFALIQATSKYVETIREIKHQQKVFLDQAAGVIVSVWEVKARKIDRWDQETGQPIFGDLEVIFRQTVIPIGQDRTFYVPANYGQVEFMYDTWGPRVPYNGRVSGNNFFDSCSIKICGSLFAIWTRINVDGVESKY